MYSLFFPVKRYDYIVNGEALKEIQEYVKYEHTFAEYQKVSVCSWNEPNQLIITWILLQWDKV